MPKSITITRVPFPGLAKKLSDFSIQTIVWIDFFLGTKPPRLRHHYNWTTAIARKQFGASDGYFNGVVRFSVYHFIATLGRKKQALVLYSYPANSRKGSDVELIEPVEPDLVEQILIWFEKTHPDCPPDCNGDKK